MTTRLRGWSKHLGYGGDWVSPTATECVNLADQKLWLMPTPEAVCVALPEVFF